MKKRTVVIMFLIAAGAPVALFAIGVSVSPATLSAKAASGKEATVRFTVSNPSKEVGLFEAYPEEFEGYLTLIPSRFVLEAGEKREVLVRARRRETGLLRTAIAVEAHPLGTPSLGVGGGVQLPFVLEVSASGGSSLAAAVFPGGGVMALWLLGALTLLYLQRRVALSTLKRLLRGGTLTK